MLVPQRNYSSPEYRYGFNGMEKDDELKGTGNSYDFGARIYDPRIGRFFSPDPMMQDFPMLSPYLFARNSPIRFIDVDGRYAGEPLRSLKSFIQVLKNWSIEALKNKQITYVQGKCSSHEIEESDNRTLLRVFNHDITSATKDQIVTQVSGIRGKGIGGKFSYYQNIGASKSGAFIDVGGFPLDIKHFMKNVSLGNQVGETIGNKISLDEEYWQAIDPKASHQAKTSSFSPEDLLSNSLGLMFSRYDDDGDFVGDLEGFLKEASTLFKTNKLENGKYIDNKDVKFLRGMIKEHYGTDNFKDFVKGSDLYKKAAKKLENKKTYKFYLEKIYSKIK